jgi:putative resolvase
MRLLADPSLQRIVVEHPDRLMRFGCEYVEERCWRRRAVADLAEVEVRDDLVPDMVEELTSFCARLYPRRSAGQRARKAIEAIRQ